jgi:hypothetical protein
MLLISTVVLIASVVVAADGANQPDAADAPFRVVSYLGTRVRVDIGADRARAESLRHATVLTQSGAVPATLVRTHRTCQYLCGEDDPDGRECHYEAELRVSRRLGTPIAVFAGTRVIADVSSLAAGPDQPIRSEQQWLEATPFDSEWGDGYQWERFPDGVYLSSTSAGRDFYAPPIALASCTQRLAGPFTVLTCADSAELLYEGGRAVVFSVADYGEASVQPRVRFQLDGKDAVLIRFGLKTQETVALLVREDAWWRLALRGADYALIC